MKSTNQTPKAGFAEAQKGRFKLPELITDETGAVFLEFLIVLFPFMFILFGTIQVGLICCASFYTNYANFMALRTAAVRWELNEQGLDSGFDNECRLAAMAALQPMEHFWYDHPFSPGAQLDVASRITVNITKVDGDDLPGNLPKYIKGTTEYQYYLIVPFANFVFGGFDKGLTVSDTNSKRNMLGWRFDIPATKPYPTLTLRSSDDLKTVSGTSLPHPHEMVVQRRWLYTGTSKNYSATPF